MFRRVLEELGCLLEHVLVRVIGFVSIDEAVLSGLVVERRRGRRAAGLTRAVHPCRFVVCNGWILELVGLVFLGSATSEPEARGKSARLVLIGLIFGDRATRAPRRRRFELRFVVVNGELVVGGIPVVVRGLIVGRGTRSHGRVLRLGVERFVGIVGVVRGRYIALTSDGAQRLTLSPFELGRIGATAPLQVQMLSDCVVKKTHDETVLPRGKQ